MSRPKPENPPLDSQYNIHSATSQPPRKEEVEEEEEVVGIIKIQPETEKMGVIILTLPLRIQVSLLEVEGNMVVIEAVVMLG